MGQGVRTALATIVGEELDADFYSIRVINPANGRVGDKDVYANCPSELEEPARLLRDKGLVGSTCA